MDLSAGYLPQSWYKGEGLKEVVDMVGNFWNNIVSAAGDLLNRFADFVQRQLNKINFFGVNFGDWIKEEPLHVATCNTKRSNLQSSHF